MPKKVRVEEKDGFLSEHPMHNYIALLLLASERLFFRQSVFTNNNLFDTYLFLC